MKTKPDTTARKARRNWKPDWLIAYREKGTVKASCEVVGISRQTAYEAREKDPKFAAAWDAAESAVTLVLEETMVERAINGSDRLMEFALKARRPEIYREGLTVQHSGQVRVTTDFDAEVAALVSELKAQADEPAVS